jgi:hypothetical protein
MHTDFLHALACILHRFLQKNDLDGHVCSIDMCLYIVVGHVTCTNNHHFIQTRYKQHAYSALLTTYAFSIGHGIGTHTLRGLHIIVMKCTWGDLPVLSCHGVLGYICIRMTQCVYFVSFGQMSHGYYISICITGKCFVCSSQPMTCVSCAWHVERPGNHVHLQ